MKCYFWKLSGIKLNIRGNKKGSLPRALFLSPKLYSLGFRHSLDIYADKIRKSIEIYISY